MKFIKKEKYNLIILLVGLFCYFFCGGTYNIPIFVFIWPLCFLYLERNNKNRVMLIIELVSLFIVGYFKYFNLFDSFIGGLLTGIVAFIEIFIPLLIDKIFYKKLEKKIKGFSILLMPLVFTSIQIIESFVFRVTLPLSHALTDNISLMQSVSIIGTHGLTLLLLCLASVVVYIIENVDKKKKYFKVSISYFSILFVIILFGSCRLAFNKTIDDNSVRVAVLSNVIADNKEDEVLYEDKLRSLTESVKSASDGQAEIVVFGEKTFHLAERELEKFISNATHLARRYHIYIILPIDIYKENDLSINKEFLIDNNGKKIGEYTKSNLVPFIENGKYVKGDKNPLYAEITLLNGSKINISSLIGYDINDEFYVSSINKNTDILFVSNSYSSDDSVELFRAIENGVSVVNASESSMSSTIDYLGNVNNSNDKNIVFANVLVNESHSKTLYYYVSLYFEIIILVFTLIILLISIFNFKKKFRLLK